LAAAAVVCGLVPISPAGAPAPLAAIARWKHSAPVPLAVAFFVAFSLIAHYWTGLGTQRREPRADLALPLERGGAAGARVRSFVYVVAWVAAAVVVAFAGRARLAEAYSVSSASMLPTFQPGDEVLGEKWSYGAGKGRLPSRGDVVAFPSSAVALAMPDVPARLLKRVIGLPGDRIRMQSGMPVINGWLVPSCDVGAYIYPLPDGQGGAFQGRLLVEFIDDRAYLTVHSAPRAFTDEYLVKPGEVFVLGDNRSNSVDSRAYNEGHGGGVPESALEARLQWFVVGTHLDGRSDWTRLLKSVDALGRRLHLEGVDRGALDDAIGKCLGNPPKVTHVPPPGSTSRVGEAPALGGM
jgi:signal peptidase I